MAARCRDTRASAASTPVSELFLCRTDCLTNECGVGGHAGGYICTRLPQVLSVCQLVEQAHLDLM